MILDQIQVSIADGKVYLGGMAQSPYQHFPMPVSVCLNDLIEEAVRKALAAKEHND